MPSNPILISKLDYQKAHKILKQLKSMGTDSTPYCALIDSVALNQLPTSKALQYWNDMKVSNIKLDANAYTSIIGYYSSCGLISRANQLYTDFIQTKQTPTIEMNIMLMELKGKLGQIGQMEKIYQNSVLKMAKKTSILFGGERSYYKKLLNALIKGYSWAGQREKALIVWERILQQSELKHIDSSTLDAVWHTFGLAKMETHAIKLWGSLLNLGIQPTISNVNSYSLALLKCNKVDDAINLVSNLEKLSLEPTATLLNSVLSNCPSSQQKMICHKLKEKYPKINIKYQQTKERESLPMVSGGLTELQLKLQMHFCNGVLLLPAVKLS